MPQLINRVPPGLLSLLDIKSLGLNPVLLSDELGGTIELGGLYIAAIAQEQIGQTAAVAAPGAVSTTFSGSTFRPPPGELWVVEKAAAQPTAVLGAGQSYRFRLCVYDSTLGPLLWVGDSSTGAAGDRPSVGANGIILGPGQGLGIQVDSVTAGTASFQLAAMVAVLKF